MILLMDSDCLIKLVKSSLKETVCRHFSVVIPAPVKREIVQDSRGTPDAEVVENNLKKKLLSAINEPSSASKGEDALYSTFQSGGYDAICSDDKRFIRRLRLLRVPYLTPAVLMAVLWKNGELTLAQALRKLESLAPMISDDEYSTVRVFLEGSRRK